MATPAQIAANRLNAMRSTGPRTDEGRAVSRMNALRHGADARTLVIPGEDPDAFTALSESYRDHFRPHGPEQEYLVETLVQSDWLRRRYLRIEGEMLTHALSEPGATLAALHLAGERSTRAIERVRRHYEAAQRAWLAAHKQLERLLNAEVDVAAALALQSPQPQVGFVPPPGRDPIQPHAEAVPRPAMPPRSQFGFVPAPATPSPRPPAPRPSPTAPERRSATSHQP